MDIILNELPLVKTRNKFLTTEECEFVINLAKDKLSTGQVVDKNGDPVIQLHYRDASSVGLDWRDHEITRRIFDKVAEYTGHSVSQFESFVVTHYVPGQHFKVHQDYFMWYDDPEARKKTEERCQGGNRISTVLLYLNDVPEDGETWFPWMDIRIKPEQGKIAQFDYGYDEWNYNIRSQHSSVPFASGEKWIISIWIHETDMSLAVPEYKKFYQESKIFEHIKDTVFELEVGPEHDRRTLRVELPANNDPRNTLLVGFTGGIDSALLLYLITMLNQHQLIPYKIQPVAVTSMEEELRRYKLMDFTEDEIKLPLIWKINEDWQNVEHMLGVVRNLSGGAIKNIFYVSTKENVPRKYHVYSGMNRLLNYEGSIQSLRYCYEFKYVFFGTIETPADASDDRWKHSPPALEKSPDARYVAPFRNLQKYHIVDAILQLDLLDLIEQTSVCPHEHESLDSMCPTENFACNERRWAWTVLNKRDMGEKYLLKGKTNHE